MDVAVIIGLCIHAGAVTEGASYQWRQLCELLLGVVPEDIRGGEIKIGWLYRSRPCSKMSPLRAQRMEVSVYDLNMTKFICKFTTRKMVLAWVLCHEDAFNSHYPNLPIKLRRKLHVAIFCPAPPPTSILTHVGPYSLAGAFSRRAVLLEMFEEAL